VPSDGEFLPWMNGSVFPTQSIREKYEKGFALRDIETRRFFLPNHQQQTYSTHTFTHGSQTIFSTRLYERGLLFPSGPKLSAKEFTTIAQAFQELR
jgi:dTDP-4-amino-4,6-dideoxygalactose transaminase